MATGKRASMREGPLADLFRKTTDDVPPAAEPAVAGPPPSTPASSPPPAFGAPPARSLPHPSLDADLPQPEPEPERVARSAHERLNQAFSADIPEDVLQPPTPAPDVYARPERELDAFTPPPPATLGQPVLRVVGVGGAGVNAVNRMVEADINGVEFLAINTDLQSLQLSAAHETLHIGDSVTRGLGSGSDPELGRKAAREEYDRIKAGLRDSEMGFTAGRAGG
ncbi:MAG: cell division protein FtsZ, partial [Solirubrobacteraceae bacterium]